MNLTFFAIFLGPFSVGKNFHFPTKGHSFTSCTIPEKNKGYNIRNAPFTNLDLRKVWCLEKVPKIFSQMVVSMAIYYTKVTCHLKQIHVNWLENHFQERNCLWWKHWNKMPKTCGKKNTSLSNYSKKSCRWDVHIFFSLLSETNIHSTWKFTIPKGKAHLPTIMFAGGKLAVKLWGCKGCLHCQWTCRCYTNDFPSNGFLSKRKPFRERVNGLHRPPTEHLGTWGICMVRPAEEEMILPTYWFWRAD